MISAKLLCLPKLSEEEPALKEGIFTYVSLEPGGFGDVYYCLYFKDEEPEGNEVTEIGHCHGDVSGRVWRLSKAEDNVLNSSNPWPPHCLLNAESQIPKL